MHHTFITNTSTLRQNLYKHEAKQQAHVAAKPKRGYLQKTMNIISNNLVKYSKQEFSLNLQVKSKPLSRKSNIEAAQNVSKYH